MQNSLQVHDWREWQSYRKDRGQPPWIKVHRCLMRDHKWVALSDTQRGHLISIWILAADNDGLIPDDPNLVKKLCYLEQTPDIDFFVNQGLLDRDAKVTSQRRQHDAPEAETEAEAETEVEVEKPTSSCKQPDHMGEAGEVFIYWRETMNHPRAKLDEKRRRKIRDRLKDGYTVSDLMRAIDGCKRSPHHMGDNDRATVYDDIELICRDAPHVDKFLKLADEPDMTRMSDAARKTAQVAQRWLNES